jgi:hypothetical protein
MILRSFTRLGFTFRANAAKDDTGFNDAHTVRVDRVQAWCMADDAIDVLNTPAPDALNVVVIIVDTCFIPRAGGIRKADPANQPISGEVLRDQVDRLQGNSRQDGPYGPEDHIGIAMRMPVQKIQDRHALRSRAQSPGPQGIGPVRRTHGMCRKMAHVQRIALVFSNSIQTVIKI